jgi:hypothetical protein
MNGESRQGTIQYNTVCTALVQPHVWALHVITDKAIDRELEIGCKNGLKMG